MHRLHRAAVGSLLCCASLAYDVGWARAEEAPSEHAAFIEAGGAAVLYSVNYEYRFIPELGLRAGISVVPLCIFRCTTVAILPVSINGIVGEGNHHFEYGAGFTYVTLDDDDARFVFPELGYRYENPSGGFLFRATFTPLVRLRKPKDVLPWGGVSFGYGW
jgi:hypothetical protein